MNKCLNNNCSCLSKVHTKYEPYQNENRTLEDQFISLDWAAKEAFQNNWKFSYSLNNACIGIFLQVTLTWGTTFLLKDFNERTQNKVYIQLISALNSLIPFLLDFLTEKNGKKETKRKENRGWLLLWCWPSSIADNDTL